MNDKRKEQAQQAEEPLQTQPVANPFENNRSSDDDVAAAAEELEKEQEFKEALTERD